MDDRTLSDHDMALVLESQAIEAESARAAGKLGYMARAMVQATMPHGATKETVFRRRNGAYTLTMLADPDIGLPYGALPRLLLGARAHRRAVGHHHQVANADGAAVYLQRLVPFSIG
jgi:hypothetical protein